MQVVLKKYCSTSYHRNRKQVTVTEDVTMTTKENRERRVVTTGMNDRPTTGF